MRRLILALSLLFVVPLEASASLQSLVLSAKQGSSLEAVMQQAKKEKAPVDQLLKDLVAAGVVNADNLAEAVSEAIKADPASAGSIVSVALRVKSADQAAVLKAAFAAAPAQASQIEAAAKDAGVDAAVITAASAKTAAKPVVGGTSSPASTGTVSAPSAGGGGGGGSSTASPN